MLYSLIIIMYFGECMLPMNWDEECPSLSISFILILKILQLLSKPFLCLPFGRKSINEDNEFTILGFSEIQKGQCRPFINKFIIMQ